MKINKTSFIAGAGSAVLLGAALIPGLALAQSGSDTATPTPTSEATSESGSAESTDSGESTFECGPGFAFGFRLGAFGVHLSEELADALGVTTEELRAAADEVRDQFADVERPTSEAEVEALREEFKAAFADALGVTIAELEAAQDALQAEKQAALIARIEEAVADGSITQERADELIERIESGESLFLGRGHGPRFGGFGEFRGFGGFGGFPGGPFGGDWDEEETMPASVTPDA